MPFCSIHFAKLYLIAAKISVITVSYLVPLAIFLSVYQIVRVYVSSHMGMMCSGNSLCYEQIKE